jgi:hypothetical protein
VDDLGALLAFGFGLTRHRAAHVFGQVDVFDFHGRHLDAPGVGLRVENPLQV